MPGPRALAAIGMILLVFSNLLPTFLTNLFIYLFDPIGHGVLNLISFIGFLLWVSGNVVNFLAWRGLAGGKDGMVGFLFILSALVHIYPFTLLIYPLLFPIPFVFSPLRFIILAVYAVLAILYARVGYVLTRI